MKLVRDNISIEELQNMSEKMFDRLVKAVVDVEKGIMVVDAEFHSDQEQLLLEQDSQQDNLWGINIYPDKKKDEEGFIEFDSMINLRTGNKSRGVNNPHIQDKTKKIIYKLVTE